MWSKSGRVTHTKWPGDIFLQQIFHGDILESENLFNNRPKKIGYRQSWWVGGARKGIVGARLYQLQQVHDDVQ